MSEKDGIQSFVDFVKYILTVSGAAIAFIVRPDFYGTALEVKVISSFSAVFFGIAVIAGLLVHARSSTMLFKGEYKLLDGRIKFWGTMNLIAFSLGFACLVLAIGLKMWCGV